MGARGTAEAFRPLFVAQVCFLGTVLTVISCHRDHRGELAPELGLPDRMEVLYQAAGGNDVALLRRLAGSGVNLEARGEAGETPLMRAAEHGALNAVEFLACNTSSLTCRDAFGRSAFAYAIAHSQVSVASLLLASGAPVDDSGHLHQPLLVTAVLQRNHPALLLLLENQAGRGMNDALREALKSGQTELAAELLRFGADPNVRIDGEAALCRAVAADDGARLDLLIRFGADPDAKDAHGKSALLLALESGKDAAVGKLLEAGADPDLPAPDGQTPLRKLVAGGRMGVIGNLLDHAADPAQSDADGVTLLGHALANDDRALMEELFKRGVKLDVPCRGMESPVEMAETDGNVAMMRFLLEKGAAAHPVLLHRAIEAGNREMAAALLDFGASVDAADAEGDTGLAMSARCGDLEMARFLLQRGANVLETGREGQEPLVIAVAAKHPEVVQLLIDSGADPDRRLREPYSKAFGELAGSKSLSWYMARDSHFYPLMVAAATGDGDTIRVLMANGVRKYPYTRSWKRYPISFASEGGHIEAQQLLVGYDPKTAEEEIKVVVNLTTQKAVLYKNGEPTLTSRVSTGKPGYATPTGDYVITHKHRHWNSSLYGSSMPYFMRLSCAAFGLHVGYVPGYPASHGCIRMPESGAVAFWNNAPVGTPVSIVK